MSKKKPAKKGKAAEPAEKNETIAISSDQSEEATNYRKILRIMTSEIESEKRVLSDFHQQIDKIKSFWAIERKRLEDLEATQRRKNRALDDLAEKHNYELGVYKIKICHVLHEQQARLTDIRTDNEIRLNHLQTENRSAENELRDAVWDVKQQLREFELGHIDLVRMQKHEHEKNVMKLRREYQRRAEEMRLAFEDAMASVRKQKSEIRKADVKKIERIKSEHIAHLTSLHKDEFQQIKNYYHDITHNNLDLIKSLKEEVLDLKKKEHNDEKSMAEISQINKRLSEPLKKHLREIEDLRAELRNYERDKVQLQATKEKIVSLENKLKNISWEYEVLFQKEEQAREERDLLQAKLDKSLNEVQKRSSFRTLLLESKIEVLHTDIEKKETALHQVLMTTNLQPELLGEPSHRLEDVLQQKNEQIKELQDRHAEIKAMHAHVIQVYSDRLRQFRIHPAEIGFQPEQLV